MENGNDMRLKERVDELDFRLYALEAAVRLVAQSVGAGRILEEEGVADSVREGLVEAHLASGVPKDEAGEAAEEIYAYIAEILDAEGSSEPPDDA